MHFQLLEDFIACRYHKKKHKTWNSTFNYRKIETHFMKNELYFSWIIIINVICVFVFVAGDHVKFGFPQASAVTLLTLGLLQYKDAYKASGHLDDMYDCIRWPLEWLLKCHTGQNELYIQVQLNVMIDIKINEEIFINDQFLSSIVEITSNYLLKDTCLKIDKMDSPFS